MILWVRNSGQTPLTNSSAPHPSVQVILLLSGGRWAGLEGPDGFIPCLGVWWDGWKAGLSWVVDQSTNTTPMYRLGLPERRFQEVQKEAAMLLLISPFHGIPRTSLFATFSWSTSH